MGHPFHRTLGPGPYKFVGMVELRKTERGVTVSDPYLAKLVKTGIGTCSHCGTAIMNCCIVRTGNGELYGVGTTCIIKSAKKYEPELHTKVQLAKRELDKRRRQERENRKAEELRPQAKQLLEENLDLLNSTPHPSEYFASQGKTLFDYLDFSYRVQAILNGNSRHNSSTLSNIISKIRQLKGNL